MKDSSILHHSTSDETTKAQKISLNPNFFITFFIIWNFSERFIEIFNNPAKFLILKFERIAIVH